MTPEATVMTPGAVSATDRHDLPAGTAMDSSGLDRAATENVVMELAKSLVEPVLVTGAAGFIGCHLIRRLLGEGRKVIAFELPQVRIPAEFKGRVEWLTGDLRNPQDIERAACGVGTVFHLAAMVGDWGQEELHRQVTVEGSRHLFEATVRQGARVILASSIVVYGDRIGRQVCTEETSFGHALGPYSRCKQAQEQLAWHYHRERGMRLTVVRPANVFGPGSKPWVLDVIHELRKGTPSLVGGGDFEAGLVYVENLVDIFLLVAPLERTIGGSYNACDCNGVTWREYFSALADYAGTAKPKPIPFWLARSLAGGMETAWRMLRIEQRPPLTREALNLVGSHHRISMERVRKELGYSPRIGYGAAMLVLRRSVVGGGVS